MSRYRRLAWLPFRWHPVWCLIGAHNPIWSFDHDEQRSRWLCWHCRRELMFRRDHPTRDEIVSLRRSGL